MDKNYLVTKSNYFIMNSSYDLSLEEQKLILTLASMVQPSDEEFKPYKFKIAEFIELLGIENQAKYTETPKITKELMKKVFEIQEGNKLIQTAWLSSAIYEKGTGYVELTFSPYLKPYMLQLSSMFTQYKLANILSMKSKYSPRIYEILKCNEFKKQGYVEIELVELRKLLKAENIYPLYGDFKRRILHQAQKELGKLSDISFEFEEIKTGRTITALKFYIKPNIQAQKEISATKLDAEPKAPQEENYTETVKAIIKSVVGIDISDKTANEFYKCAAQHETLGNEPIDLIREVAEYSKTQNITKGFVGWVKSTVKTYVPPITLQKVNKFTDYDQRGYDWNELEKGLNGEKEIDLSAITK